MTQILLLILEVVEPGQEYSIALMSHKQTFYHSALLLAESQQELPVPFIYPRAQGARAGGPQCTSPTRTSHRYSQQHTVNLS